MAELAGGGGGGLGGSDAEAVLKFIRGADAVFHVASLIELRDHKYRQHRLYDVNVTGATNIINACIRTGVSRLVYTSSTATVMDDREVDGAWTEEAFADVRVEDLPCHYAITKKCERARRRQFDLFPAQADTAPPLHRLLGRASVRTTRMAEERVLKANGRGRLRTIALRPFVPFGPGDRVWRPALVAPLCLARSQPARC